MWEPSMGTSHRVPKPVSKQQKSKKATKKELLQAVCTLGTPQHGTTVQIDISISAVRVFVREVHMEGSHKAFHSLKHDPVGCV
jgi:hypothetical protein